MMIANFLIGLREGLEAVLIVVLLLAYLGKTGRTHLVPRVMAGVGVAIAVSLAFGALLTFGPRGLTFEAQEAIGGTLSLVAVGFVTWMIFWMARTSRSMATDLRHKVDGAADGKAWMLVLVAALAVGREGLETALFIWAAARATGETWEPIAGAALGLAVAVVMGALIHRGAVKINFAKFFSWTGAALIIVAAGVLAYGIHDLQEAGILPGLHRLAFDVSHIIPPSSWYGTVLKGVFNFSPATTWLEATAWTSYVVPVFYFYFRGLRRGSPKARAGSPAGTAVRSNA